MDGSSADVAERQCQPATLEQQQQSADASDRTGDISVITLNCYAGQPVCSPFGPASASLQGSRADPNGRLNNQLRRLRALSPDVLCLQEIHTLELCKIYSDFFQDTYDAYYSTVPRGDEDRARVCWLLSVAVVLAALGVLSATSASAMALGCFLLGVPPSGQLPASGWPGARAGWLAARVHPVSLRFMHDACMI